MKNIGLFSKLLNIDWLLILLLIILVSIGCFSLYSAADGNWSPWAIRHFQRGVVGIFIVLSIALIDIKIIYKFAWLPLFVSLLFLSMLYITSDGSVNRWLNLGAIQIQPSELAKISIILALARYFPVSYTHLTLPTKRIV